jgi:hypothetical protein
LWKKKKKNDLPVSEIEERFVTRTVRSPVTIPTELFRKVRRLPVSKETFRATADLLLYIPKKIIASTIQNMHTF